MVLYASLLNCGGFQTNFAVTVRPGFYPILVSLKTSFIQPFVVNYWVVHMILSHLSSILDSKTIWCAKPGLSVHFLDFCCIHSAGWVVGRVCEGVALL